MGRKALGGAYDIIMKADSDTEKLQANLTTYFTAAYMGALPENQIKMLAKQLTVPWLTDFIKYDPAPNLAKVTCPTLALNGSMDSQVPAKENLAAIQTNISKSGNKDVTVQELEGLNHLFQSCKTGLPQEYAKIEETFSPVALGIISSWIIEKTK